MESYLKFTAKSFQKQITYKVEYFVGLVNGFLYIFIFTSLWNSIYAMYSNDMLDTAFTQNSIISYAIFSIVIKISFTMDDQIITRKVRTGSLITDLIKPINYFCLTLSECIGQTIFHAIARALPILIFSLMVFDVTMPERFANYALLFLSGTLGYFILFMINYLIGLLAFWFIETFSFQLMKYGMYALFSGGIIPIDFFPEGAQKIITYMPFKYILYIPTCIFLGRFDTPEVREAIISQAVWAVILFALSTLAWHRAMKKLVIQGG